MFKVYLSMKDGSRALNTAFVQQRTTKPNATGPAQVNISIVKQITKTDALQEFLDRYPQFNYVERGGSKLDEVMFLPSHCYLECPTEDDYMLAKMTFGCCGAPEPFDMEAETRRWRK